MSTGTTFDHLRKRNAIVEAALRRVGAIKPGEAPSHNLMRDAIRDLNDILREEDQDLSGEKAALWAMSSRHLFIEQDHRVYTTDDEAPDKIPEAIVELLHVFFRNANGNDSPVRILSPRDWQATAVKDETGDPQAVFLEKNIVLADQKLFVWPLPSDSDNSAGDTFGDIDTVTGTDGEYYDCILAHEASAQNRPITGADWPLFWQRSTTVGSAWSAASDYTTAKSLLLHFKRPLYDFDGAESDPDMPSGWSSYLLWRLCVVLASSEAFKVSDSTYNRFLKQLDIATNKLFPTKQVKTTDYHNKARYF